MRKVLADNLEAEIERYYASRTVADRIADLGRRSRISPETVRRILRCETGASIDIIELISSALKIAPYTLLVPSERIQSLLSIPKHRLDDDGNGADELQRPTSPEDT